MLVFREKVLNDVDTIVRITQNTDDAVAFGRAGARVVYTAINADSISVSDISWKTMSCSFVFNSMLLDVVD